MSLKSFTSSAARRVRIMSGLLVLLLAATFSASSAYAETLIYTGSVDMATDTFAALTPVGTLVGGDVEVDDAAFAGGLIGIADITDIGVAVGGFCFTFGTGTCVGTVVPITSIDAAAITFGTGGSLCGSFSVTAFSPTFQLAIPIDFDLDGGRFFASAVGLGTVEGPGSFAPSCVAMMEPEIDTNPIADSTLAFGDVVVGDTPSVETIQIDNLATATAALTISATVAGNPADLVVTDNCMGSVPIGGSCTVTATLTPVTPGVVNATITISSNDANEGSLDFPVTANILAPASLINDTSMVMPLMLNSVAVGDSSTGLITVTNTGGATATLGTVTMPAAPFALTANDNCSGAVLAGAADCTIEVEFAPTAAGMFDSSFSVDFTVPLANRGVSVSTTMFVASSTLDPAAIPSADPLMIADTMVNNTNTGVLTITNSGDADLIIMMGDITGLAAPFSVTAETCTAGAVAPMGGTCDITIEFAPTVEGNNQTGTLSIVSNDPATPLLVGVTANGTEELLPNIMVTPTSVLFATPLLIGDMETDTITVSNMGTADLVINSITIAPDPAVDFTQANDCVSPLAPMATCTIDVTFAPQNAGPLSAVVTIDTDDPDTPLTTVDIDGTGVTPEPNILLSTALLDLGVETIGNSTMGTVTVTNTGTANLSITSVTIPAGDYTQMNTCEAAPLAPMGICTVTVTFTPSLDATITDTLTIVSTDPDAMMSTVSLTGRGVTAPEPNISSLVTDLDLGNGLFGATLNGSVLILNNGNAVLNISAVTITGTDAAEFMAGQDCVGMLAAGADCTVTVQFDPAAPEGGKTAMLQIASDDTDTPIFGINLTGSSEMPQPQAVFSTMAVAFADTVVSQTATETVTISNTGTGELNVNNVALTGMGAVFTISAETCTAAAVAVNGSCDVMLSFTPDAENNFTDTLTIDSDDPTTPMAAITIAGDGIAVPAPDITVDVMSLAFGSVVFGDTGTLSVTITNAGDADLTVNSATVPMGEFSAATACGVLIPAASCTVDVTYTPSIAGDVTDMLTITSDDADTPSLMIALTGFGVAPEPEIDVSVATLTLGPVVAGTTDTMNVTISNMGMADLTIGSITIAGTDQALFSETNDCTTVAMGASCTVMVTYAPLVAGTASASLTIVSNDADEGSVDVALEGSATPVPMPMISAPASLDLGDVNAGQTGSDSITVSNNGTADLVISSVSVAGMNAADFAQNNTCATVAAGASCAIDLVFTPSVPGAATADVVIASNDAASPSTTVAVTANALIPVAMFSSAALDLGSVRIGESGSAAVTISNMGNADLVVTGAALGGAGAASYALANGCATVAAGASCAITATFTPTATGSSMAAITVTTSDPASASVNVALSATGAPMEEVVVSVKSEGGSGIGSFGGLELLALVLFAVIVRRRTRLLPLAHSQMAAALTVPALVVFGMIAMAPQALADDEDDGTGYWYAGAGFGSSDAQADQGAITRGIEDAGVTVTSLNIDDTDSGFKIYGGYQATELLAVELGYVDLGQADIDLQLGNVTVDQLPLISRNVSGNVSLLGSGIFGAIVARQSVTDNVGVFGRVGLVSWEVETAIGGTTSAGALNIVEVESGTDFTFGIGVEAWIGQNKRLGFRAEWERYEMGDQDAEFLSLGGLFRF